MDGNLGKGCHTLSPRSSTTLPHSPTAPPASEISTASVSSCRRMRIAARPQRQPQRDFAAERSAARAANRLPRLAQAASRIKPASSINPATNARTGRPRRSPYRLGRARTKLVVPWSFGIGLFQIGADGVQIGWRLCGVTPGLQMSQRHEDRTVVPRAFKQVRPARPAPG